MLNSFIRDYLCLVSVASIRLTCSVLLLQWFLSLSLKSWKSKASQLQHVDGKNAVFQFFTSQSYNERTLVPWLLPWGLKMKASKINPMFVCSVCTICIFSSPLSERVDYPQWLDVRSPANQWDKHLSFATVIFFFSEKFSKTCKHHCPDNMECNFWWSMHTFSSVIHYKGLSAKLYIYANFLTLL